MKPPSLDPYTTLPYILFITLFLLMTATSLLLNHGVFTYKFDDAYIFLAVAEKLSSLHYGINMGEFSSPSSSIIWPFLFAPFSSSEYFLFLPFIFNFFVILTAIHLLLRIFTAIFGKTIQAHPIPLAITIFCLTLGLNFISLIFLGMEHAAQVAITLLTAYGLIIVTQQKRLPLWLLAAIIIGPLLRYENLAVSLASLLFLLHLRYYRQVVCTGAVILLCVGGFSLFLHQLGLPLLPTSILTKLELNTSLFPLPLIDNLLRLEGLIILGLMALLLFNKRNCTPHEYTLALSAAFVCLAHLAVGSVGWLRYETYVFAFAIPVLCFVCRDVLIRFLNSTSAALASLRIALVILCTMNMYVSDSLVQTPLATHYTYRMHHQLQRFVKNVYKGPVAVSDIGYIALNNPYYVLDMAGIASKESREFITAPQTAPKDWMDTMLKKHGISLAIVNPQWYAGKIPGNWIHIADIKADSGIIRHYYYHTMTMGFYATSEEEAARVRRLLKDFSRTLPEGVAISF